MLNLKSNFKNKYKDDVLCPRCQLTIDNENHLFGECKKLEVLYSTFKIKNFDSLFTTKNMHVVKSYAQFLREVELIMEDFNL